MNLQIGNIIEFYNRKFIPTCKQVLLDDIPVHPPQSVSSFVTILTGKKGFSYLQVMRAVAHDDECDSGA